MRRRLTDSPTIVLLGVMVAVFLVQWIVGLVSGPRLVRSLFALSTPVTVQPWTVVSSVFAHNGVGHLASNAVAFAVVGLLLERETTDARFYAFFVLTGALAGLAQVWFAAVAGSFVPGVTAVVSVWGASGAVFALFGYLLTSNRLTERIVGGVEVSPRVQLLVFAVVAAAVTVYTGGARVALVAHFTGLLLGLLAGRLHVLRPRSVAGTAEPA